MFISEKYNFLQAKITQHPFEKFTFFVAFLLGSLLTQNILSPFLVVTCISTFFLYHALSVKALFQIAALPMSFMLVAVLSIICIISQESFEAIYITQIGDYYIGFSQISLDIGIFIIVKAMGAMFAFYFLILTSPIDEIEYLLRKMKLPDLLVELFVLSFRFITILLLFSRQCYLSQKKRMAYRSFSSSIRSLGMLISSVLIKSLIHADFSQQALLNRGYRGEMRFIEIHEPFVLKRSIIALLLMIALVAIGQLRL
ncbi:energy-coupling factor transporter transmembrane component T [Ancylomarina euxinus]|uniref:energy-coupling factor transporter transmembrane component T n=1 Tax=Ancylomarina euxinus TaxID=2283627 RepID=UPI001315A025|nr:energy-coupling factor transporter transmembrane component T [Ancylomarina euxinus]MCZ4695763.1 energy-coupling factor transporter transmembrane component T [Ancylomarina euxinus]